MHEDHQREQCFFDPPTIDRLAGLLASYQRPLCLCAPTVAEELLRRGRAPRLLEIDARFAHLPGFLRWDLYRPLPENRVMLYANAPLSGPPPAGAGSGGAPPR
jgi:hypothetical protein